MIKTFAAATLAFAVLVGPAAAQNARGPALVAVQLDAVITEMGLTPGARVTGRLAHGRSQLANIEAPGGQVYFLGVCDENCRDFDLIVRDSSGRELGRDDEPNDATYVSLEGATAGLYTLEVSMADCTGECHWGVGVFR